MQKLVDDCALSKSDFKFFEELATSNNMSGRGIMRVLSVARTIADIDCSPTVKNEHLCEALTFRVRDKSNLDVDMSC